MNCDGILLILWISKYRKYTWQKSRNSANQVWYT